MNREETAATKEVRQIHGASRPRFLAAPATTCKLTPKQTAFAHAYLETGNASEAYRRAYNTTGMKPETLKVKACELLRNGNVAVTVVGLQAEHAQRHNITV